jgi:hypothetical protein
MSYQQYSWNINLHQKSEQNGRLKHRSVVTAPEDQGKRAIAGFQMSIDHICLDSQK